MLKHILPGGFFFYSALVTAGALLVILFGYGIGLFFTAVLLALLEITLSFDNAVVNAKILKDMSPKWQRRFLTWGILIAVVGTRLILPILIVAVVAGLSPWVVTQLAFFDPKEYGHLLHESHHTISAFGAAFLFMVALRYFFDEKKEVHWIESIEKRLSTWGNIEAFEIGLVLLLLFIVSFFIPEERGLILGAGIIGVVLFIFMEAITHILSSNVKNVAHSGLAGFLYLEVLDTAFSLDGVIAAFAITTNLAVIAIGLCIGAYFVRSITVFLVREGTLSQIKYLEHGAHWAIFGLAASMVLSLLTEVSEIVVAGVGLVIIIAAYYSSMKETKLGR